MLIFSSVGFDLLRRLSAASVQVGHHLPQSPAPCKELSWFTWNKHSSPNRILQNALFVWATLVGEGVLFDTCANDACSLLPEVSSESMPEMPLQIGCNFWLNNGPI